MSGALAAVAHTETASQLASFATSLAEWSMERFFAEVVAARERVLSLQTEADKVCLGNDQRFMYFVALTLRIHAILQTRIEAFTEVFDFNDIQESVRLELRGPEGRGFHGGTTTLSVPSSDACSGKVALSFRVGHDGSLENAIIDCHLEILTIFIKFDSHDQLVIPIDNPSEPAIASWIDDTLGAFARTYFEICFAEQNQKPSFSMNRMMGIRLPRAFAAGRKIYQGQTYHFYTRESLQAFENTP